MALSRNKHSQLSINPQLSDNCTHTVSTQPFQWVSFTGSTMNTQADQDDDTTNDDTAVIEYEATEQP